ncbi:hypothetical protein PCANB_000091 [Pneumocystis canis]|nr:hypothetical protein PCANB_000091 [Pneumocystis canis]
MDQWYALHHEGKGPFTRIIEYYMMDEEECIRQHINRIKILSEKAKKRLSYQNAQRSFIYKLKFPEQFDKENFSTNIETKTNNY